MVTMTVELEKRKTITKELSKFVKEWGSWTKVAKRLGVARSTVYWKRDNHAWSNEDIKIFVKRGIIDEVFFEEKEKEKVQS